MMEPNIDNSEIINQKKQFIFNIEQTSNHVFPNEVYKYYVYIKNISGTVINNFTIKIENSPGIHFDETDKETINITLQPDEVLLYEMKAYCPLIGKYTVHFIGFGEGTQILYETLTIRCTRTYNSDNLLHRIHIYDFTPYEDKYSMEADNYSEEVTQMFKRQKLPYKAGDQPFPMQKNIDINNIESQSFIDQYNEARNTKEHVYQYISRENFTEDSIESYTGENLAEIFNKINKESDYFNAKLIRSGTNYLLNDFTQYAPNGFLHRMGLLNSEIYHYLGVIPTYSYMSDRLFRWAPSEEQLLSLTPKKEAMRWGENIWAGRGWIVYRLVTDEYSKTEEFKQRREDKTIEYREIIGGYEEKRTAEEVVKKLEEWDDIQRTYKQSDIIKYIYQIEESLYDTGVFFINIPINKIPSNFYLLNNEDLYSIINRVKPYGTKPIVNYIIEKTFNNHMEQSFLPNYHKNFTFDMSVEDMMKSYEITENNFIEETIDCGNGNNFTYKKFTPTNKVHGENFFSQNMDINVNSSSKGMNYISDLYITEEPYLYSSETDKNFSMLEGILETLYQGNYDSISFKFPKKLYTKFKDPLTKDTTSFSRDEYGNVVLQEESIESLKLRILNRNVFEEGQETKSITIEDIFGKKYKIEAKYDTDLEMECITYSYINLQGREIVREEGYQNIESIAVVFEDIFNKKILIFMVEDKEGYLHYFHHIIVQDISSFDSTSLENISYGSNDLVNKVIFETPFVKRSKTYSPKLIKGGENWTNLYRLNNKENTYSYIKNLVNKYITPDDIYFFFDQINIQETAIIDKMRFKVKGRTSLYNNIYIEEAFNTNYLSSEMFGDKIQLSPKEIQCYSQLKESTSYYKIKLDLAKEKGQENIAKELEKLLEENYIFNEDADISTIDYLEHPNDFFIINKPFWYELSEFTDLSYKLNEISSIKLIIEGYNSEKPIKMFSETLSETNYSSTVETEIPSGYFRKKINLLYPNEFLLELLRVRFRFNLLNHDIKIFDTKIELKFKNKQEKDIIFEGVIDTKINEEKNITLLENYYNPADINNGTIIKFSFDDLNPGEYYYLNSVELEVIYTDTDMNIMINDNKYQTKYNGINKSSIFGISNNTYLSGIFYDDVATMMQLDDNVGVDNNGIELRNAIYQMFESRDDNITSIEIFPYGFKGSPDETLKLGLYTNSLNTPDKLIEEVYISGWVKNNDSLKNLNSIKYNININELDINEKYWFKLEVLNQQENSYYVLKGINNTKSGFKLLADENNNYINTFSNLKFNIYSTNLSQSFGKIPTFQDNFDNPYIVIGLHKGIGTLEELKTGKIYDTIKGDDYMSEVFEDSIKVSKINIIQKKEVNGEIEIIQETEIEESD